MISSLLHLENVVPMCCRNQSRLNKLLCNIRALPRNQLESSVRDFSRSTEGEKLQIPESCQSLLKIHSKEREKKAADCSDWCYLHPPHQDQQFNVETCFPSCFLALDFLECH